MCKQRYKMGQPVQGFYLKMVWFGVKDDKVITGVNHTTTKMMQQEKAVECYSGWRRTNRIEEIRLKQLKGKNLACFVLFLLLVTQILIKLLMPCVIPAFIIF